MHRCCVIVQKNICYKQRKTWFVSDSWAFLFITSSSIRVRGIYWHHMNENNMSLNALMWLTLTQQLNHKYTDNSNASIDLQHDIATTCMLKMPLNPNHPSTCSWRRTTHHSTNLISQRQLTAQVTLGRPWLHSALWWRPVWLVFHSVSSTAGPGLPSCPVSVIDDSSKSAPVINQSPHNTKHTQKTRKDLTVKHIPDTMGVIHSCMTECDHTDARSHPVPIIKM